MANPDPWLGAGFQWDDGNVEKNWVKHRVRWSECEEVFFRTPRLVSIDQRHSSDETRYGVLGRTESGRRLAVFFTVREGRIRVISARDMSRRELEVYDHAQEAEADPEVS